MDLNSPKVNPSSQRPRLNIPHLKQDDNMMQRDTQLALGMVQRDASVLRAGVFYVKIEADIVHVHLVSFL